jgi:hypothetical protein
MAEIEIRTTGELMLGGNVIGQITFTWPFIEDEAAGVYDNDQEGGCDCYGDEIEDLEEERDELKGDLDELIKASNLAIRMMDEVLPEFGQKASPFSANAIRLMNEARLAMRDALRRAGEPQL